MRHEELLPAQGLQQITEEYKDARIRQGGKWRNPVLVASLQIRLIDTQLEFGHVSNGEDFMTMLVDEISVQRTPDRGVRGEGAVGASGSSMGYELDWHFASWKPIGHLTASVCEKNMSFLMSLGHATQPEKVLSRP